MGKSFSFIDHASVLRLALSFKREQSVFLVTLQPSKLRDVNFRHFCSVLERRAPLIQ